MENAQKVLGKVGERFLYRVWEDGSIGEFELIEPTPWPHSDDGTLFTGKWWDGELSGCDYFMDPSRIVERTPENIKAAGKQLFPATPSAEKP